MISTLLKLTSLACCAIVVLSFATFASDQAGHGSKETVSRIASADESQPLATTTSVDQAPVAGRTRQVKRHGELRQKLDAANHALTSPFAGVAGGGSAWTQHIVAALLALLTFGVGLGFLARYASMRGV